MNHEETNQILFKNKLSGHTIERLHSLNYLPSVCYREEEASHSIQEWGKTFVGQFVRKYPKYYSIIVRMEKLIGHQPVWGDFTKQNITLIVDMLSENAMSSAKTYLAMIKSILNDAKDEVDLPYKRFAERMSVKSTPSVNVYLNLSDIKKIESFKPATTAQQTIWAQFLVSCYTGARHSDVMQMSVQNIQGGYLHYVSQKTKTATTVEAKPILRTLLPIANRKKYSESVFNDTIRKICQKVGINDEIRIYRKGEYQSGEKWQFVASHTARRSFATNLAELGVDLLQIARRMGHANTAMTMRYIVCSISRLSGESSRFFE